MKRRSADMELSIYPKPQHLSLWLQSINSYFYSHKAWKTIMVVIWICINFSFILKFWPAIKNETGKKFKSLHVINLVKYSSEFLVHLRHTDTSTSAENDCMKMSGFAVGITRLFLQWEITRNVSCREKFFNPKIRSQVLRTNPIYFFHYLSFHFRLNKISNNILSKWT